MDFFLLNLNSLSSACFNEYYICTLKHALDKDSKNMGSSIAIDNFLNYSTMLKSLLIIKLEVIINYNEPVCYYVENREDWI